MIQLLREIHSQPDVLERLLRLERKNILRIAGQINQLPVKMIFVVARGSSDNAALYAKYLFGARNRLVVAQAAPSLFTLYRKAPDLAGSLVLAISQSGASNDLCEVVSLASRQGATTLVITNTAHSPLSQEAEYVVRLHAGAERSIAATKTYTAELMALAMLSCAMRGSLRDFQSLERVPEFMESGLQHESAVAEAVERYRYADRLEVVGRGYNYATAFEISLKLKELAYLVAEPLSSADFRHGPIAVVQEGFPVIVIASKGRTLPDLKMLAAELRARGAELLVISDTHTLLSQGKTRLAFRSGLPEWLSPLLAVVPGQLFAMHLAMARGCAVDHPRGLSKITKTR